MKTRQTFEKAARQRRKIALFAAIILHLAAFAAITQGNLLKIVTALISGHKTTVVESPVAPQP